MTDEEKIKLLTEALMPFAEIGAELSANLKDDEKNNMFWAVPKVGALRTATAVLNIIEQEINHWVTVTIYADNSFKILEQQKVLLRIVLEQYQVVLTKEQEMALFDMHPVWITNCVCIRKFT